MRNDRRLVDFEFTLALNNATGAFFVCQDAFEACNDLIRNVWYWRLPMKMPPPRAVAKVLGRLALRELNFRLKSRSSRFMPPLMRNPRPLVFTGPREVMGPIAHSDLYHPLVKFTFETAVKKIYEAKPLLVFVSKSSMTNFVNLHGNDTPMKLIYPALRGGVESAPGEPIEAAPLRFLLRAAASDRERINFDQLKHSHNPNSRMRDIATSSAAVRNRDLTRSPRPQAKRPLLFCRAMRANTSFVCWLYEHASGFVMPSLLEGFGLPAAAAISRGLVPLRGRGQALHEVAGESAILVGPLNTDEIADGMRLRAHMGQEERQARLPEIRQSIARFSRTSAEAAWRSTLQQALAQ